MEMNQKEAQKLVETELAQSLGSQENFGVVVLENETIEHEWGWVFFYQSKEYLKTGDFRHALAGNAPYIVNRKNGQIRVTGTAHPIEYYIQEYEQSL